MERNYLEEKSVDIKSALACLKHHAGLRIKFQLTVHYLDNGVKFIHFKYVHGHFIYFTIFQHIII